MLLALPYPTTNFLPFYAAEDLGFSSRAGVDLPQVALPGEEGLLGDEIHHQLQGAEVASEDHLLLEIPRLANQDSRRLGHAFDHHKQTEDRVAASSRKRRRCCMATK